MPAVARAFALAPHTTLAALALAPVTGASAAAVRAPDGLSAKPRRRQAPRPRQGPRRPSLRDRPARAAEQWALQGDAPMGVDTAWRQTTGADVTVAIIDSGIDLGHPDLAPNLWTNPGEIPGNGVDDDGNGFVDDVHGYDFVDNDGSPQDANGHGTHVAGIVGARGGNGIGGAGVAWQARLMAIRVLDGQARGTTAAVAAGIRYAVDNGARIVNLSLAGPTSTPRPRRRRPLRPRPRRPDRRGRRQRRRRPRQRPDLPRRYGDGQRPRHRRDHARRRPLQLLGLRPPAPTSPPRASRSCPQRSAAATSGAPARRWRPPRSRARSSCSPPRDPTSTATACVPRCSPASPHRPPGVGRRAGHRRGAAQRDRPGRVEERAG